MGTPLGPKYIPYTYMDPLGYLAGSIEGEVISGLLYGSIAHSLVSTRQPVLCRSILATQRFL